MASFDEFWTSLVEGLENLVKATVKDFAKQAKSDGQAYLNKSKDDLERWADLLATGQLTEQEFRFLVEGKADVAEMLALKQAGLALVRIEKFQKALMDLVVNTAVDTLL